MKLKKYRTKEKPQGEGGSSRVLRKGLALLLTAAMMGISLAGKSLCTRIGILSSILSVGT